MAETTFHRPFRFGVVAAQARSGTEWLVTARRAEQLGYATLLVPDRVGPLLSPIPALSAVAAATTSLRLGTFVLVSGWRNPVLMAQEAATLDFLSGGRFELGLGAGTSENDFRQIGIPVDRPGVRIDQLAEALGIVKALLSGQEVTHQGAHYTVSGAQGYRQVVQKPRPPILVGGSGNRLLALAAREADIISMGTSRDDLSERALAERIDHVRQAAGDRFPQIELSINLMAVLGDEPPSEMLRQRVRGFLGAELEQLIQSGSPFVVAGSVDEMCGQLLQRRERLGISYVTLPADLMDTFAPVVERLSGR